MRAKESWLALQKVFSIVMRTVTYLKKLWVRLPAVKIAVVNQLNGASVTGTSIVGHLTIWLTKQIKYCEAILYFELISQTLSILEKKKFTKMKKMVAKTGKEDPSEQFEEPAQNITVFIPKKSKVSGAPSMDKYYLSLK